MTNEEALEVMEKYHSGRSVRSEDYMQAFDIAIGVLSRRIPKKPKGLSLRCPWCDTPHEKLIHNLGNPANHKVIYCWNCGKAIDLEEEHDG